MPALDMFWGDRYGQITDPFGHEWSFVHDSPRSKRRRRARRRARSAANEWDSPTSRVAGAESLRRPGSASPGRRKASAAATQKELDCDLVSLTSDRGPAAVNRMPPRGTSDPLHHLIHFERDSATFAAGSSASRYRRWRSPPRHTPYPSARESRRTSRAGTLPSGRHPLRPVHRPRETRPGRCRSVASPRRGHRAPTFATANRASFAGSRRGRRASGRERGPSARCADPRRPAVGGFRAAKTTRCEASRIWPWLNETGCSFFRIAGR